MATIDDVRALIGDDTEPYTYTDEQIQALLDATQGNGYIAGALLLERAAVTVATSVRTDDLQISGKDQSSAMLLMAQRLRDMDDLINAALGDEAFTIVYRDQGGNIWPEASARPWGC